MLRILKDCILCGVPARAGEMYPIGDFDEQDIQIVVGLGFAERFTPTVKKAPETPVSAPEYADEDKDAPKPETPAKTARKRKK